MSIRFFALIFLRPGDRTAGVQVHNIVIPGVGKGTTWDFGAQTTFHSAHGLFFSPTNTIFIPLLCSKDGEKVTSAKDLLDRGRYWCAFAKAAMRTIAPHLMTLIRVFFVFNVIGCRENDKQLAGFQLQQVVDVLTDEFGDTFTFAHVVELDCSKSNSARMNHCREKLKSLREQVLEVITFMGGAYFSDIVFRRKPMMFPNCATRSRETSLFQTRSESLLWAISSRRKVMRSGSLRRSASL